VCLSICVCESRGSYTKLSPFPTTRPVKAMFLFACLPAALSNALKMCSPHLIDCILCTITEYVCVALERLKNRLLSVAQGPFSLSYQEMYRCVR